MPCESGRRSRDQWPTVKQRFLEVSSNLGKFWKKSLNGHATVVGGHATVGRLSNNVFWTFQEIWENFEKSRWTVTRQWLRSRDRRPTVKQRFWTFRAIRKCFEKSRWTVTRQWSEVTRPSADCQTTFFGRFKRFGKILKKVVERSRDNGWGHATVGRLSKNVFSTFQAIRKFFEKSRWTVTRQWSEVTRPSADCQTTFFGRFKRFWKILIKVAERSRDSGWGHATVGRLSNNVFWTFQAIRKNFEKSRWTVTRQWSEVTRPSADCQTSFLDVLSNLGKFWKKSLNGHATVVGGHAAVGRLSKTFFGRFKRYGKILKNIAERSRDNGWGHATVGRLSNKVFWTFQAIRENFEKVLKRPKNVVWQSADGRVTSTTVAWPFSDFYQNFPKSLETSKKRCLTVGWRSRDLRPLSRDRSATFFKKFSNCLKRPKNLVWQSADGRVTSTIVAWPFSDVFQNFPISQFGKILKKSLNGHATVIGSHATIGWLSNKVFWTFQAIRNFFEKSRWTVTRQWSEVTRLSADCQAHICIYIIINERERERGERETEYYVAFGRRIADEGVYEMLTCSKLNADLLDVFRGG